MKRFAPILAGLLVAGAAGAAHGAAANLSATDRSFIVRAAESGAAEVMQAQLALERAQRADVKSFARRIIVEDGKANTTLQIIVARAGVTQPTPLTAARTILAVKPPEKFDLAYIGAQRDALRDAAAFYRQEAANGSYPALKKFAMAMLPIVQQQYRTAKELPGNTIVTPGK